MGYYSDCGNCYNPYLPVACDYNQDRPAWFGSAEEDEILDGYANQIKGIAGKAMHGNRILAAKSRKLAELYDALTRFAQGAIGLGQVPILPQVLEALINSVRAAEVVGVATNAMRKFVAPVMALHKKILHLDNSFSRKLDFFYDELQSPRGAQLLALQLEKIYANALKGNEKAFAAAQSVQKMYTDITSKLENFLNLSREAIRLLKATGIDPRQVNHLEGNVEILSKLFSDDDVQGRVNMPPALQPVRAEGVVQSTNNMPKANISGYTPFESTPKVQSSPTPSQEKPNVSSEAVSNYQFTSYHF